MPGSNNLPIFLFTDWKVRVCLFLNIGLVQSHPNKNQESLQWCKKKTNKHTKYLKYKYNLYLSTVLSLKKKSFQKFQIHLKMKLIYFVLTSFE